MKFKLTALESTLSVALRDVEVSAYSLLRSESDSSGTSVKYAITDRRAARMLSPATIMMSSGERSWRVLVVERKDIIVSLFCVLLFFFQSKS